MVQSIKNYLWHLPKSVFASVWYGFPAKKLTIVGVTGTKGKTTVVHMIEHILRVEGFQVARISTIGAKISDEEIDTGLHVTTPDSLELQKILRRVADRSITHAVLEVTSNGLDQFRVWGIPFSVGVITNIASDHLDYHGTFERYLGAKLLLARQSRVVILHRRSQGFAALFERVKKIPGVKPLIVDTSTTSPFEMNRELALNTVSFLTVPEEAARAALAMFPGVPGRMETVYKKDFRVIIDFAHTPESLETILKEIRPLVGKTCRLIAVFGCAGERDPGRRKMGVVAARLADFFIITAEDPRSERVEDISEEIARYAKEKGAEEIARDKRINRSIDQWISRQKDKTRSTPQLINSSTHHSFFARIPDRQEAITAAIRIAKKGDVVVCLGKGHEKSMCYGKQELPWSEHEVVRKVLRFQNSMKSSRSKSDDSSLRHLEQ